MTIMLANAIFVLFIVGIAFAIDMLYSNKAIAKLERALERVFVC